MSSPSVAAALRTILNSDSNISNEMSTAVMSLGLAIDQIENEQVEATRSWSWSGGWRGPTGLWLSISVCRMGSRPESDEDTSTLSMFLICPNQRRVEGVDHDFDCSVKNLTSRDVVPEAEDSIGRLYFTNIFKLARLISVYGCERKADREPFRKDRKFMFIIVTGV
ncbi:hypothetical protein Aduo_018923 [Ancylostoma duodenale]